MRTFVGTAWGAVGLTALTVGLAGTALAMPTPVGSAQEVVRTLEASGFEVILNTVGTSSLDKCVVTALRPGPAVAQSVAASRDDTRERSSRTTVYVDIKC
jgi:hypothetical protein